MSTAVMRPDERVVASVADWRLLARLLRHLKPYRGLVAAQLVLLGVASLLQVLQPLVMRDAIDRAIPGKDAQRLLLLVLAFAGLVAVEFASRWASTLATIMTGQGVVRDLRKLVMRRMLRLDQATFDRMPVGRLMVRATSDVEALEEMFSSGVVTMVGDVARLVMLLVAMLLLDVPLTLASIVLVPVFVISSEWFRSRLREAFRLVRAKTSALSADLQEVVLGMRVVKAFGQQRREERRFNERSQDLLSTDQRAVNLDSTFSAWIELLSSLAVAALVWYGGGRALEGVVTFGTLFAFIAYAQQFFGPLQDLSTKYAVLQGALASCERVFALLDEKDAIRSPPEGAPAPPAARGEVEFEHVTFAYGGDAPVLRDVSFRAEPGRTVALVGATGSGKTTITRLVNRLHDVARDRADGADVATTIGGVVRLDGVDVRDYPLDVLRRRVGVVLQEPFLFSGSVRESLFVGEGAGEDARAWAALASVGVEDVVRRIGGLDAELTERGSNLSVGERQLLSIARALLHDPVVLLLDEATASVDSLSERRVQEALRRLRSGRTVLIVAHRLSTVRDADLILVLHRGRLRERGTHDELLAHGGLYATLWRLQLEA
jgi:ATP-binding cassette subfamily B protein